MSFTTHENPYIRREPPKPKPERFTTSDGRVFETTGEFRRAKAGEFVKGPMSYLMGPALVNRDTTESFAILREVTSP